MGDHTETIQIDYDPNQISYGQLLAVFWSSHNPYRRPWSRQYQSAIYFHDDNQQYLAENGKRTESQRLEKPIHTVIEPVEQFYRAELYHQKYQLRRNRDIYREFAAMYPRPDNIVDSTAAARVNGYLGGYGGLKQLQKELPLLGLSNPSQQILWQLTSKKEKRRRNRHN